MSDYWVCSDDIDGKENTYINALCDALKKKGHTATNGGVGPNTVQSHGLGASASGQIGVFIVGGSDAGMYVDFRDGIKNGYYKYKIMWVVFASNTATTDKWLTCNGLANTPLVRAHDDNYSGSSIESVGKTAKDYFDANKQYIRYACGKLGCSFDDVINNFLQGGGMGSGEEEGSSASTIKDAIKEVLSFWDGEVECVVRNEYVYINKIPAPQESYIYNLVEGLNVTLDSVNITDYNPDTINFLTVHWQGGEDIVLRDEKLIERFGEKPLELDAVKKVTVTKEEESSTSSTDTISTDSDTDTTDSSDESEESSSDSSEITTTTKTSVEEVPVETLEEAENFANVEWAKIKRDDGHSLECKVSGSEKWKAGEWCRVILPSFDLDDFMYISKISQSESATDWTGNLSLVDYPPSFGEYNEEESSDEEGEEEEVMDEETSDEDSST